MYILYDFYNTRKWREEVENNNVHLAEKKDLRDNKSIMINFKNYIESAERKQT